MNNRELTTVGNRETIMQAYKEKYSKRLVRILCMYNSTIDMIIQEQDQDLMTLPIDDRMANRAHGIQETINLRNYQYAKLDQHLERLQTSAKLTGINIPLSNQFIKDKLNDLAQFAYTKLKDEKFPDINTKVLMLRILVSTGNGDFGIYGYGKTPTLYAIIYIPNLDVKKLFQGVNEFIIEKLWTDKEYLAQAKTVNYLENSIMADYSKQQGGYQGIRIDQDGVILEGAISNIAFVTNDNVFGFPPLEKTIKGTTLIQTIEFIRNEMEQTQLVESIQQMSIHYDKVTEVCKELFFLSGEKVIPILSLDGQKIGDGSVGPVCKMLQQSFKKSMSETACDILKKQ